MVRSVRPTGRIRKARATVSRWGREHQDVIINVARLAIDVAKLIIVLNGNDPA
ncbi:MAG TPA: hypothetical protein VI011_26015 [Asanoa sp.]